jgi:hypothetical protein
MEETTMIQELGFCEVMAMMTKTYAKKRVTNE